jgi:hypothetical protein
MVEPAGIVSPMSSAQDTRWVSHIDYTWNVCECVHMQSVIRLMTKRCDHSDSWGNRRHRGSKSAGFSYC